MTATRRQKKLRRRQLYRESIDSGEADKTNSGVHSGKKEKPFVMEYFKRTNGPDVTANLSKTLFNDDYHAVTGLVANSFDADAHNVHINVSLSLDRITVEDDGKGMDVEGINSFLRNAGSLKKEVQLTGEGRRLIGNKGIESSALVYLAEKFEIETAKDGQWRVLNGETPDDLDDRVDIACKRYEEKKSRPGTKVTLEGLKYAKEGREFHIEELNKRLARDMPISDDFKMYVNGQEIKQVKIKTATEYVLDADTPTAGKIRGIFYVVKQTLPENSRGVYLKVTGRTVTGMEGHWNVSSISMGLGSKTVAFVYADGLRKKVSSDWTRVEKGSRQFKELDAAVKGMLKMIKSDYDNEQEMYRESSVGSRLDDRKRSIVDKVMKKQPELMIRDIVIPTGKEAEDMGDEIGHIQEEKDGTKKIVVSPRYIRTDTLDSSSLQRQLDDAVLVILSMHLFEERINKEYKAKKTITEKMGVINEWKQIFLEQREIMYGDKATLEDVIERVSRRQMAALSEVRLYSDKELYAKRGIDTLTIRKLVECGALDFAKVHDQTREGFFFAKEVYNALEPVRDSDRKNFHTPLWKILRRMYTEEKNYTTVEITAISQFDKAREKGLLPDYIIRVGKDGKQPFYWVKKGYEDACVDLLASEILSRKRGKRTGDAEIDTDDMPGGKNNPLGYNKENHYETGMWLFIPEVGKARVNYAYNDEGRFFVEKEDGIKVKQHFEMAKIKGKSNSH